MNLPGAKPTQHLSSQWPPISSVLLPEASGGKPPGEWENQLPGPPRPTRAAVAWIQQAVTRSFSVAKQLNPPIPAETHRRSPAYTTHNLLTTEDKKHAI